MLDSSLPAVLPQAKEPATTFAIVHLPVSARNALKFLSDGQYYYQVDICNTYLPYFGSPTATAALNIGRVQDNLWCFTEAGSVLGNIMVRSYFGVLPEFAEIVVAGHEKVQHRGGPRRHVVLTMQNRVDYYQSRRAAG